MKKIFTLLLLVSFGHGWANAQCVEIPKNRVLLVGDSWAAFMNGDQTITNGLKNVGHSDKKFTSTLTIAENGAQTDDFLRADKQTDIQNIIDANPQIDIVHLSIGGNDLLGDWDVSMTQAQTDSLALAVRYRLDSIVDFLEGTRPGMRVFWAGYTYPNFEEVIEDVAPFQTTHPFYGTWNDMGQPDFITINTILNEMSDSVAAMADTDPQLDFVPAQGILQYTVGQNSPLGVAPGGTYPPQTAPLPLGYPDYPSPKSAMRLYAGIFTDAFHLSPKSYLEMFTYQAEKFYQKFFMDDLYTLSSGGNLDGSVTSNGIVSQELEMGEDVAGNEIVAVVSFDTQNMADTTLSKASIFLRRESIKGTNPIVNGIVQVKMVNGNFGTTADVEAIDFTETGDVSDEVCKGGAFGNNSKDGNWFRIDLTAEMLQNINSSESVQFMISVPGFTGGSITFSDATNPEWAPILNFKYGETPAEPNGINDVYSRELPVYPIPTTGALTIGVAANSIQSIEVINLLGSIVLNPSVNDNRIDISELPVGSYILRITTDEGISAKRILKR